MAEAAEREGELGVDEDGGGGEASLGTGELGGESELEAELSLTGTALADEFGDGGARDAAAEAAIEYGRAHGALVLGASLVQ